MIDKETGIADDPTTGFADMESSLGATEGLAVVKHYGLGLVAGLHGKTLGSRIGREIVAAMPFAIVTLIGLRRNRAQGGSQRASLLLTTLISYAEKRKSILRRLDRASAWAYKQQEQE
ncbi:MAG TPA: hypothetical protein VLI05_01835 [Candidatus Saccharimonadia bacterium]|nr:hypothetical protein [Candidatus Saccharimonadia bacterium]